MCIRDRCVLGAPAAPPAAAAHRPTPAPPPPRRRCLRPCRCPPLRWRLLRIAGRRRSPSPSWPLAAVH
eukprot:8200814-Alexandrium_andersonii.AAC.1